MAETQEDTGSVKRVSEVFGVVVLQTRDGLTKSFVTTDYRGANELPERHWARDESGNVHVELAERDDIYTDTSVEEVDAMVLQAHQSGSVVGPK